MSDTSDEVKNDRQCKGERLCDGGSDNVCRDFVRGICDRRFCKYKHENEIRPLNFCHDFQNNVCPRPNCKFIHCTPEEVEEYKKTGEMSNQILAEATRKNQLPGALPVCNQFRKGMCRRPVCKYRHITKEEEEAEILALIQNNSTNRQRMEQGILSSNMNSHELPVTHLLVNGTTPNRLDNANFETFNEFGPTAAKRRFLQSNETEIIENGIHPADINRTQTFFKGYFAGNPPALLGRVDARTIMLEEEISLLHKEIAQLKRQVSDLTATNEFLLDQNATLRVSSKRNGSVSVPSVTLTNSLSQDNGGAQPQPQQVIRTVAASVATVPVSLATVTTCNPVSGNPVSIAGCPAVSIASPAQILAPSQQILVTTNPSPQLALATTSQAQLAIAQQNLANNLAQQAAQPQLTSQQLTSQAQHIANQQLALASAPQTQQIATQQLTTQQLGQQLTSQAQQLANQQLTSQAQQLALANTTQQLTSQAQQLAQLANTTQLTSQAQQLALANTPQQLAVANVPQQLALAGTNQQLLAQQSQMNAINTSQTIAMSNATQPMVSYPIMTQSMTHALQH